MQQVSTPRSSGPSYTEDPLCPKIEVRLCALSQDNTLPENVRGACRASAGTLSAMRSYNTLLHLHGPQAMRQGLIGNVSMANQAIDQLDEITGLPPRLADESRGLVTVGRAALQKIHLPGSLVSYNGLIPLKSVLEFCDKVASSAADLSKVK